MTRLSHDVQYLVIRYFVRSFYYKFFLISVMILTQAETSAGNNRFAGCRCCLQGGIVDPVLLSGICIDAQNISMVTKLSPAEFRASDVTESKYILKINEVIPSMTITNEQQFNLNHVFALRRFLSTNALHRKEAAHFSC